MATVGVKGLNTSMRVEQYCLNVAQNQNMNHTDTLMHLSSKKYDE